MSCRSKNVVINGGRARREGLWGARAQVAELVLVKEEGITVERSSGVDCSCGCRQSGKDSALSALSPFPDVLGGCGAELRAHARLSCNAAPPPSEEHALVALLRTGPVYGHVPSATPTFPSKDVLTCQAGRAIRTPQPGRRDRDPLSRGQAQSRASKSALLVKQNHFSSRLSPIHHRQKDDK